ncbi:VOC family protein [Pseudonocardia alaniniphila]|uniref:VOC family protein n=1 Tax=Pseudonocardia alaniniphila TaxID=75291 RepID=A0ABS9TTZ0_9PSEU|nr:VOC family protein [Pseudonocardia alaniniphila]MCH6171994.1 VOC family protein [Pseudonocardia alaniniphila]
MYTDNAATRVSKVGYVEFTTPEPDRLVEYYQTCLGFHVEERSPEGAYLTTGFDHHSVVIRKGGVAARTAVGYQVVGSLDDAARRITDAGYEGSRRSDIAPSTPDVLVLAEPGTDVPLHLYESQKPSGKGPGPAHQPTKLGHVAAFSPSLTQIQGFYQDLLGFRWSDTIGDFFVFLRCNADHHAANFLESSKFSGMHHVAYEMRDLNHLQTTLDHLARNNYRLHWGPGRHGPGHNIFTYHHDPDGNTIELFTQLDQMIDEANGYFEPRPWHEDSPQFPKTWDVDIATANAWGPVLPEILDH